LKGRHNTHQTNKQTNKHRRSAPIKCVTLATIGGQNN
jgi:hypothetical protein